MPFEVPSSWVWTTLGEICFFENGYAFSSDDYANSGIPLIRISNIKDNQISTENCVYIQGEYEDKFHICNGDLLIAMSGATTGKMGVYLSNKKAYLNQRVGNIKVIDSRSLCLEYRNFFLQSKSEEILKLAYGGAQPNISGAMISSLQVPLPPISEQKRIVSEIERWFALIDQIEQGKADLQTIIKQAKSKILDLAIHGKLVPQNPNDEPASELLKRINPKTEITCDNGQYENLTFEIPNSWEWCRLGDIISIKSGDSISVRNNRDGQYPIYGGNGINGYYYDSNVDSGTIVIGRVGFYCGCVHITASKAWVTDNAFIVYYKNGLNTIYLKHLLEWLQLSKTSNSTAQPVISGKGIYPLLVPLPPLAEQQRIVDTINKAFAKLDVIMESL